MKSELIKAEENGREYPCLVIDRQTGDGERPTVYLKPAAHISIVVVLGYLGEQRGWRLGQVLNTEDVQTADDYGVEPGTPIQDNLPLFDGKIVLEN